MKKHEHHKMKAPTHEIRSMPHEEHHEHMERDFRRRFYLGLAITIPILLLSPTVQGWFSFSLPTFAYQNMLLFILASIVALYNAFPFYSGAAKELKKRRLGMMVLVSIAVLSGYLFSVGTTFFFEGIDFYWEISTLVVFLLFGHWMEMRAVRGATGALGELVKLIPPKANLITKGKISEVETAILKKGDIILVKPGEKIPIDGVVIEGESAVNESLITGESKPVEKKKGDDVIGGTLNINGSLRIKVTKTGNETALAQIISLVRDAQESKPPVQKLADRAAHYLTIAAVVFGLGSLLYWFYIAGATLLFSVTTMITVIVIACPHALGLAIPTVTTISTTLAAKNGILVKNAEALELGRKINIVMFDKTGTLTKGEFGVTDIISLGKWNRKKLLSVASGIEANSEHVIAKGIVKKAKEEKVKSSKVTSFKAIPGKGARAKIGSGDVLIGNTALMKQAAIKGSEKEAKKLVSQGKTVVYIASGKEFQGIIALADIIREESREAVKELKGMGMEVAMLTGDNEQTAKYVASELGVDRYFAEVLPGQKSNAVKTLQKEGKKVAMVGDGVNDAPALVQADVGIAIGTGTDVAVESAEIVLVRNDPRDIPKLIRLSKATMRKMKENLLWATGYNTIAIPVAAGIFAGYGITLRPEWGALIMAASSIIVVSNALLLKRENI